MLSVYWSKEIWLSSPTLKPQNHPNYLALCIKPFNPSTTMRKWKRVSGSPCLSHLATCISFVGLPLTRIDREPEQAHAFIHNHHLVQRPNWTNIYCKKKKKNSVYRVLCFSKYTFSMKQLLLDFFARSSSSLAITTLSRIYLLGKKAIWQVEITDQRTHFNIKANNFEIILYIHPLRHIWR